MTNRHIRAQRPVGFEGPKRAIFARAQGRSFSVNARDDEATITLYDEIGYWGVTASAFRRELDAIDGGKINLRINSPGGDVFDGIAIYNDLIDHPAEVRVSVTGIAASAASLVAMAGRRIEVADNASIMIHNAWGVSVGSKEEMRGFADVLEEIDSALGSTYARRTGLKEDEIAAMMKAETWLRGQAAVDKKFADAVAGDVDASARFDLSLYKNAPRDLSLAKPARPESKRDVEAILRDAGLSHTEAKAAVARLVVEDVRSQRDAVDGETFAAIKRLTETIGG